MSCRNGEVTSTILASAKPHYVGVGLPEHGFGNDFDAMIQFYRERGEDLRAEYSIARTDHLFWIYFTSASAIRGMRKTSQSDSAENRRRRADAASRSLPAPKAGRPARSCRPHGRARRPSQ